MLNLPTIAGLRPGTGRIADPDAVARLAERAPLAAAARVRDDFVAEAERASDWPDLLAEALRTDPGLSLTGWADAMRLNPASVSRGFARAYGVSPKRFRLEARARHAALALSHWHGSLAGFALDHGFADQAHLNRAVLALTGQTPGKVRSIR